MAKLDCVKKEIEIYRERLRLPDEGPPGRQSDLLFISMDEQANRYD